MSDTNKQPNSGTKYTFKDRQELKNTQRLLIKLGSSVVTRKDGKGVALPRLTSIIEQLANCHAKGIDCCIVSSGAVAFGKKILLEELNRKGLPNELNISQKRAAAALGQPQLMGLYKTMFDQYGIGVAQVLISNGSMLQADARDIINCTINELLSLKIIPIINTNDAVNVPDSGRFDDVNLCDNDLLAVALAAEIKSDLVILATDVDGLYDKPPSEEGAKLISNFKPTNMMGVQFGGTSNIGTGGMDSKVKAGAYALSCGVSPVICNGEKSNFISSLLDGDESIGTFFYQ